MRSHLFIICMILLSAAPLNVWAAEDVYQSPSEFISQSYDGVTPTSQTLQVTTELQTKIAKIMGSKYKLTNVEYWPLNGKTLWILEAIGKYEPITAGFLVGKDATLERVKVLIYRESHGWEVKRKFFTRQFKGAGLKKEKKLDKTINGISGATLSVNALKEMSALALLLHKEVRSAP